MLDFVLWFHYLKQTLTESFIYKFIVWIIAIINTVYFTEINIEYMVIILVWRLITMIVGTYSWYKQEWFDPDKFRMWFNRLVAYMFILFMWFAITFWSWSSIGVILGYMIVIVDECRSFLKHAKYFKFLSVDVIQKIISFVIKKQMTKLGMEDISKEIVDDIVSDWKLGK